jgi:hypothetical protein
MRIQKSDLDSLVFETVCDFGEKLGFFRERGGGVSIFLERGREGFLIYFGVRDNLFKRRSIGFFVCS